MPAPWAGQDEAPLHATLKIDLERRLGTIDPNIYGNFIEHLGRCIYGGIYDEGSPLADADGNRKDVLEGGAQARRHSIAVAGRELQLRVSLAGWNRSQGCPARALRLGVVPARIEPLRDR